MARQRASAAPLAEEREYAFVVHPTMTMPATLLNSAPYNPKKPDAKKLEELKLNIKKHGFLHPLAVQKFSEKYGQNIIVGGHLRHRGAREISIEENKSLPDLPVILLDIDDRTAKKLNITLNKLGVEFDAKLLGELLEDINSEAPITTEEVGMMGFEEDEFSKYLHLGDPPGDEGRGDGSTFGSSVTLSLKFTDTKTRNATKAALEKRAKVGKKTLGEIVFELLGGGGRKKKR